jgi:type II secretory pathway pseudopilin PulG
MRTFFKKPLNSNGDTIVEVLIVLAVLGFAFSISMATANKGLSQSRNAEDPSISLFV